MDDIYYQKYLKYKNKYLSLRKADIDDQYAGANIKVLWKVKVDVTRAGMRHLQYDTFKGVKIFEFGTVTDKRTIGGVTKKVTLPYVRIDSFGKKQIYEIKTFEVEKMGIRLAFYPEDIISIIKEKAVPPFKDLRLFEIYLDPCFSVIHYNIGGLSDLMKRNRTCQKDRRSVRLDFKYMQDHL
tara:strand:+ start:106 stop:651 length:546 start_codon:yes stop_codon:yes gene_type:complete